MLQTGVYVIFAVGTPTDGAYSTPPEGPGPGAAFGSADVLRIHAGAYRVMYEISDQQVRISVIRLGRLR
ncbi:type II toxin-antitoxin system RelE/ParE family toxin [Streptomyces sp. NPDC002055]|uniref:type II toxin-antitoxin system RelE family toxin n=1 Tax=Streptomyces sp. NPDC002055 TaxID=3154534 RepID=UPI00331EF146